MPIKTDTVTGPAFLASYLINGDDSSIGDDEREMADELFEGMNVVGTVEDSEQEFARFPLPWTCWGTVIDYEVIITE